MATFADNSVANFFFHSPWRPKWSQLGALKMDFFLTRILCSIRDCITSILFLGYKFETNQINDDEKLDLRSPWVQPVGMNIILNAISLQVKNCIPL